MFLTVAVFAALGMATNSACGSRQSRRGGGIRQVDGLVNADTWMTMLVTVNQFGFTNNANVADHKTVIGPTNTYLTLHIARLTT